MSGDKTSDLSLADLIAGERSKMEPQTSGAEALGRGAVQGATLGFGDEIAAGAKSLGINPKVAYGLAAAMPPLAVTYAQVQAAKKLLTEREKVKPEYAAERDAIRAQNDLAREEHPKTYLGGQVGGGLATALVPGVAPSTLAKLALAGGAYGAGAGLGESTADLTEGDVKGAAADTAVGGVIGAAAGLGAGAVQRGVKSVVSRLIPKKAADAVASEAAGSASDLSAGSGYTKTVGDNFSDSMRLQDKVRADTGKDFRLSPSQSTGSRSMALAEQTAEQIPGTMDAAQAFKSEQRRIAEKFLDSHVNAVASKPELLGKAGVSDQIGKAIDNHVAALISERRAVAGPLYEAAEKAAGGNRVVPTESTMAAMQEVLEANKFTPANISGQIKSSIAKIEEAATEKGRLTISDAQNLRSLWSKAASGDVTLIEGMSESNQRRIAKNVLSAIDADLDTASNGIASKEAVDLLRQANTAWREMSKRIDSDTTETVAKLLKVANTDASDTLVFKLSKASPEQVSGVFSLLNKRSPDVAAQARAQLLEDLFVSGGKSARGESIATELGVSELKPGLLLSRMKQAEPMLQAAFAGDVKAKTALRESMQLMQKLSFGPNLKGAQTAPMLAQMVEDKAIDTAVNSAAPGVSAIGNVVRAIFTSNKARAKALSTPEGIDAFNTAMRQYMSKKPDYQAAEAAMTALTRLGIISSEQQPR